MNSIQQKTQISTDLIITSPSVYIESAKADNTKKAYTSDWNDLITVHFPSSFL